MSVRKLSSPSIEAVRPKSFDPLDERIFGARINLDSVPWLKGTLPIEPDFRSAMAIFRIGRMISENFSNMGEYMANLMGEFEFPKTCRIFLMPKNNSKDGAERLEHRLSVAWEKEGFSIDETPDPLMDPKLMAAILSSFRNANPTLFNHQLRTKMIMDNLQMNDYSCRVVPFTDSEIGPGTGSLALMPFHYRDPINPSGVVMFDGDLRCRGTKLNGVPADFWTATAAMEAASQISFMLTHKFDAITILTRLQDFQADFKLGVRQLVRHQIENMYMIMLDLDDFKKINTEHGLSGGNEVLRKVAEAIKKAVRMDDPVSRIGGEEFAIILRDVASKEEARAIAERIRKAVESLSTFVHGREARVTCSIGVTTVDKIANKTLVSGIFTHVDDTALKMVYDLAYEYSDQGVQKAKINGKNMVCFNEPDVARAGL